MTFSIRQLTLVVCIITKVICNNTYCTEELRTLSFNTDNYACSTEDQSLFDSDISTSSSERKLSDNNINIVYNNKYKTINNFINKKDNNIHDFEYWRNIYQMLLSDIAQFRIDVKLNHNDHNSTEIRKSFFDILHNIKNSLQDLVLSCSDMNEKNKISTYINNNLKSRDIYFILK